MKSQGSPAKESNKKREIPWNFSDESSKGISRNTSGIPRFLLDFLGTTQGFINLSGLSKDSYRESWSRFHFSTKAFKKGFMRFIYTYINQRKGNRGRHSIYL
jgi:hypothetical protein